MSVDLSEHVLGIFEDRLIAAWPARFTRMEDGDFLDRGGKVGCFGAPYEIREGWALWGPLATEFDIDPWEFMSDTASRRQPTLLECVMDAVCDHVEETRDGQMVREMSQDRLWEIIQLTTQIKDMPRVPSEFAFVAKALDDLTSEVIRANVALVALPTTEEEDTDDQR